jgi:hypothetical protein
MKTKSKFRREVSHGGIVPPGFRMAWYEPRRRVGIYFPSPLHWVMRALHEFMYRLRVALRAPSTERAEVFEMERTHRERHRLAEEYAQGYITGWRECFEVCLESVDEEIARADSVWNAGALLLNSPTETPKNN